MDELVEWSFGSIVKWRSAENWSWLPWSRVIKKQPWLYTCPEPGYYTYWYWLCFFVCKEITTIKGSALWKR